MLLVCLLLLQQYENYLFYPEEYFTNRCSGEVTGTEHASEELLYQSLL